MPSRTAEAEWKGKLLDGRGHIKVGSGSFEGPYDFRGRAGDGAGTNPEELLGAAHAGCFSMAVAAELTQAGFTPERIHTTAKVHLEKQSEGFAIPLIELETEASVPNLTVEQFEKYAQTAKKGCPVSKALAGVEIRLNAKLV
jgi:osmotically inducible protein OsmC